MTTRSSHTVDRLTDEEVRIVYGVFFCFFFDTEGHLIDTFAMDGGIVRELEFRSGRTPSFLVDIQVIPRNKQVTERATVSLGATCYGMHFVFD